MFIRPPKLFKYIKNWCTNNDIQGLSWEIFKEGGCQQIKFRWNTYWNRKYEEKKGNLQYF